MKKQLIHIMNGTEYYRIISKCGLLSNSKTAFDKKRNAWFIMLETYDTVFSHWNNIEVCSECLKDKDVALMVLSKL